MAGSVAATGWRSAAPREGCLKRCDPRRSFLREDRDDLPVLRRVIEPNDRLGMATPVEPAGGERLACRCWREIAAVACVDEAALRVRGVGRIGHSTLAVRDRGIGLPMRPAHRELSRHVKAARARQQARGYQPLVALVQPMVEPRPGLASARESGLGLLPEILACVEGTPSRRVVAASKPIRAHRVASACLGSSPCEAQPARARCSTRRRRSLRSECRRDHRWIRGRLAGSAR